jgi:hypothetical protein
MTQRKPSDMTWESFAEQSIREAIDDGKFDRLPGFGKPIPSLDEPYDEHRWLRQKLQAEQLESLPPGLALRRTVWQEHEKLLGLATEAEVRNGVEALNAMIAQENLRIIHGPPADVMPLDVEQVVVEWRDRPGPTEQTG